MSRNRERKQKRAEEVFHQSQPFRDARRKGYAWTLLGTARMLQVVLDTNFEGLRELARDPGYNTFTAREAKHILGARTELKMCVRRLQAVAKELDREAQ